MKSIVVDLNRCNGCHNCQIACKDEHCGNDWSPIAAAQPMTGQFWCRVNQRERGRVPGCESRLHPYVLRHVQGRSLPEGGRGRRGIQT